MMRALLLSIWLMALALGSAVAQDSTTRNFNQERLTERAAEESFQYGLEPAAEAESWEEEDQEAWTGWRYLLYGFILLGLAALLVLLLRRTWVRGASTLRPQPEAINPAEGENLHRIDFSQAIAEAEEQEDYRLAIRLWFLHALKDMTDRQLIQWRPYKTDSEYLREIEHPERKKAFARLTRAYEYIWYGEFIPSQERYQRLAGQFKAYLQGLRR